MQTAAPISQDMKNLKQASARIQIWRDHFYLVDWSSTQNTSYYGNISAPPKCLQAHVIYICLSSFVVV